MPSVEKMLEFILEAESRERDAAEQVSVSLIRDKRGYFQLTIPATGKAGNPSHTPEKAIKATYDVLVSQTREVASRARERLARLGATDQTNDLTSD